jgi:hypothetical protein
VRRANRKVATAAQTDPRGQIDPSGLHAALDVERKLPTQEEILGLDRLTRSKGEPQPPQYVGQQRDQNPSALSISQSCHSANEWAS